MEDGALALENLETKLLGDDDSEHVAASTEMPPQSTSRFPVLPDFPLAS